LSAALKPGAGTVVVQSAFDLPPQQQTNIENAIKVVTGPQTKFQFKTNVELISGIELSANGFKLAWSIKGYLDELEKSISATIKAKEQSVPVSSAVTENKKDGGAQPN
jgi:F-type H+-transporting ATPase subunit b